MTQILNENTKIYCKACFSSGAHVNPFSNDSLGFHRMINSLKFKSSMYFAEAQSSGNTNRSAPVHPQLSTYLVQCRSHQSAEARLQEQQTEQSHKKHVFLPPVSPCSALTLAQNLILTLRQDRSRPRGYRLCLNNRDKVDEWHTSQVPAPIGWFLLFLSSLAMTNMGYYLAEKNSPLLIFRQLAS